MKTDRDRPEVTRLFFAVLGATAFVGLLWSTGSVWSDSSGAAARPPTKPLLKVTARIRAIEGVQSLTPVAVFFSPSVINVGTVTIVVRNHDPEVAHQFSINGIKSKWMGPDSGTSVLRVTFKRPGSYIGSVQGGIGDGETGGSGVLKVVK